MKFCGFFLRYVFHKMVQILLIYVWDMLGGCRQLFVKSFKRSKINRNKNGFNSGDKILIKNLYCWRGIAVVDKSKSSRRKVGIKMVPMSATQDTGNDQCGSQGRQRTLPRSVPTPENINTISWLLSQENVLQTHRTTRHCFFLFNIRITRLFSDVCSLDLGI